MLKWISFLSVDLSSYLGLAQDDLPARLPQPPPESLPWAPSPGHVSPRCAPTTLALHPDIYPNMLWSALLKTLKVQVGAQRLSPSFSPCIAFTLCQACTINICWTSLLSHGSVSVPPTRLVALRETGFCPTYLCIPGTQHRACHPEGNCECLLNESINEGMNKCHFTVTAMESTANPKPPF